MGINNVVEEHKSHFLKFCLVGGVATVLNYAVFFVLYRYIDVFYIASSGIGYIVGVLFGFYFNKKFTFESTSNDYYQEGIVYFLLYLISLFIGLALLRTLVFLGVPVLSANVLVIGVTTVTNYLGSKYLVFNSHDWLEIIDYYRYKYRNLFTYVLIGIGSLVVEILVISGMWYASPNRWVNISIGFVCGMAFSYVLNAWYNFDEPENRNARTFEIFAAISLFAFSLNIFLIQYVFQPFLGDMLRELAGMQIQQFVQEYGLMRFASAATVFLISYSFHIRYTFDIKKVGLAVYLSETEDVHLVNSKVNTRPDFVHLDLVDKSYNKDADPVDLGVVDDVKSIYPDTPRMVHIMSETPLKWMKELHGDADSLIFHPEGDIGELITFCCENGCQPGLCISYDTQIEPFNQYLEDLNIIQVLGIERPGVSGQGMTPESLATVARLQELKRDGYDFDVCFDGGVKRSNVDKIDAKYVVSASAVLKAQNPKRALYDLKTNARHYTDMDEDFKRHLEKGIRSTIESLEFVTSGTVVGSFVEDGDLNRISDVDIVVIADELTKTKYESVVNEFEALSDQIRIDYGYDVELNTTFGPLKFDHKTDLVLHVMVYSEEQHKYHCQRSPFTCLAWQTSDMYFKRPMTEIYKVPTLQPNHFFEKRRSITDYLSDLNGETVSYREYEFNDGPQMIQREKNMTDKDRFEFSYHIMKFSMTNFLKLYNKNNEHYSISDMVDQYFSIFSKRKEEHTAHFLSLQEMKYNSEFPDWNDSHEEAIRTFLEDFESQFRDYFTAATSVYLSRHAKTEENNDGTFLGQRRDPEIRDGFNLPELPDGISQLYSSPLNRSYQTAAALKSHLELSELVVDDRLSEIDYGKAEGLNYEELEREYPEIVDAWAEGEDPRFPSGENTHDVWNRVSDFLDEIEYGDEDAAVVSHNVVLRCILGSQYEVPMSKWHKIVVPHTEPFELLFAENENMYINLTENQIETCFYNIEFRDSE